MPATPITPATRYINPGTTIVLWVPTVANKAAITRAEINAGTNLAGDNSESDGWNIESEQVDTPDLASRFTSKIPGRLSADDSSLSMYADIGGQDARTLMPRDGTGYIVWMDGGDVAGRKCDVFPVTVAAHSKTRSVDGGDAAMIEIQYSIRAEPAENVTIPA